MSEPSTNQAVLKLQDVCKAFGERQVLVNANLELERGETLAILGPSGTGKSVTLKAINGLIPVDSGQVEVLGYRVDQLEEAELVPLRRRVSYLFQQGALFDSMNVFDNIAFPVREHQKDVDSDALGQRVSELLAMVHLSGIEKLFPSQLSGGMRKRVAVARALALEPEIILYDEPTTGLDPVTSQAIARLIVDLDQRLGVSSMVVTHDIPLVAQVAERVVFLDNGKFIFSGSVEQARVSAPEQVREFFSAGGGNA
jgi:phospholipid/cholesterol/gamma-HCH transport system ATP-binding protein